MKLILVRHGETAWNRDGVVQGRKDIELSELGRQQAELVALALKDEPIEGIYSSPLKRALETARAVARYHQAPPEVDACLMELDAGELDGLTYQEMRSGYSEFLKEWARDAGPVKLPARRRRRAAAATAPDGSTTSFSFSARIRTVSRISSSLTSTMSST